MRNSWIMGIILTVVSCSILGKTSTEDSSFWNYVRHDSLFVINKHGYIGTDTLVTNFYENGTKKSVGRFAVDKDKRVSPFKVGTWIEYYENNNIKSKGEYDISTYIQCCYNGQCRKFVNYKKGKWSYYFPNGQLRAKGNYTVKIKNISTSCTHEGYNLPFHEIVPKKWSCYTLTGQKMSMNDSTRKELETVTMTYSDLTRIWYLNDSNRNELIEDWE